MLPTRFCNACHVCVRKNFNFTIVRLKFHITHFITTSNMCRFCYMTLTRECNQAALPSVVNFWNYQNIYSKCLRTNFFLFNWLTECFLYISPVSTIRNSVCYPYSIFIASFPQNKQPLLP